MPRLRFHSEAENELDALYETDEDAAALVDVLLEVVEDQGHLDGLFRPSVRYRSEPLFEVKEFQAAKAVGRFVLILKVWNHEGQLLPYRIFIGYNSRSEEYWVLSVIDREISYETDNPAFATLLSRYDECNIPVY